jgi:hypothetical protein
MACLCLVFSQTTLAGGMPDKPANCPSASALKSGGFFMAQEDQEGRGFVAFSLGTYQTPEMWGFAMGFIKAGNQMEALMKANEVLPSLKGNPKPIPVEEAKTWACLYGVNGPYQVMAFSPLPQQANYPQLIKSVR